MKIDQDKTAQLSARKKDDEKDARRANSGEKKPSDFKALLARKSRTTPRGEFGTKLRDGRVQVGEQAELSARTRTAREVVQVRQEKRVEQRHAKGHEQLVGGEVGERERGQKSQQTGKLVDTQIDKQIDQKHDQNKFDQKKSRLRGEGARGASGSKHTHPAAPGSDGSTRDTAESAAAALSGQVGGTSAHEARAERRPETAESGATARQERVAKLAHALVDKAHIGTDMSGRQIMLMDLEVPGRGQVRVRLRRRAKGFELRMRPQNQELARDLRQERHRFRQEASRRGVTFSSIEIV